VFRLTRHGSVTDRIPLTGRHGATAPYPIAVAVTSGAVWVLNTRSETVTRIDPRTRAVVATIALAAGGDPSAIAAGAGAVWVADSGDGTLARIDPATNRLTSIRLGGSPTSVAVGAGRVWVAVQPHLGPKGDVVARVPALPSSYCAPVVFGGSGKPDVLIASDLPLVLVKGVHETLQLSDAIRFVLAERGFRAGRYSVGYQSCDDSSLAAGGSTPQTCARNAKAYAARPSLVGVIGPYDSGCARFELPILSAARGGPVATVSPSSTYVGLTRAGPGTNPGEPDRYYPTGRRNFVRVVAADSVQSAGDALLAKQLGIERLYCLHDATPYGVGVAMSVRAAAARLGIAVAGFERWDPAAASYAGLAHRIERAGADGVFVGGVVDSNGGALVRQLHVQLGRDVRIIASDGFMPVTQLVKSAGAAAEGVLISSSGVPPSQLSPTGKRFVAAFQQAIGHDVVPSAIEAAQAAEVLLDAIARSDGTRASVVRELFRTHVKGGILGTFSFDRNGDTTAGAVTIYEIKHGRAEVREVLTPRPSPVQ
jgi:branched-chain amino acid transport system substrate-binding protein